MASTSWCAWYSEVLTLDVKAFNALVHYVARRIEEQAALEEKAPLVKPESSGHMSDSGPA